MRKTYENYIKSGLEWIKEYPSNWELVKFKRLAKIRNGKDQKEVSIDEGGYPILGTGGEFGRANQFIHDKPSVLLGRKGTINKPQYIEEPFWTVDTLFYTDIYDDIFPKYLFYLSQQIPFDLLQESSAVPSMTQEKLNSVYVVKPTLKEQTKIAQYLDHQTAIIDQLIQQKEKLIELLKEKRQTIINEAVTKGLDPNVKMKDSGIEWLGKIPKHWYTSRFSRGIELLTDYEANGSFDTIKKNVEFTDEIGYAWYVRATDLENNNILDSDKVRWVNERTYNFLSKTKLVGSELLIAKRGEIGKVYLMPDTSYKATLAPNLYLVRLNKKLNPNFMWFFFESIVGKKQLMLQNRSVTIGAIYKDDLKEIEIVYPPLTEQLEIVEYLNSHCKDITTIISQISFQVERLKEYRQSIIFEAVTGKIDVRDWQPNKTQVA